MKRCYRCFRQYEDEYEICPWCGQAGKVQAEEQRYLLPGTVLGKRYLVGTVIGAGGFGITYTAFDTVLNQKVAIKEYMPGEFSTRTTSETKVTVYGGEKNEQFETGKRKFFEESRRLAKFRDVPGIVQIFNVFEENETVYIVMEFLDGETLAERLKRDRKIPEQEAVQIILTVLQALEAVHGEGILHRDIAPNNIFLQKGGGVKLLDFGAARSATGTHSKSLTVLYKEGYTPEEQYRSRGDQGPWTDVYAVAATMYRMLTGQVPPGALERRRKDTLKELSKAGAKVNRTVEAAVMNALNVDTRYRTQSAGQFMKELTGQVRVKEHFVRTIEQKVGKIPTQVKALAVVFSLCILVFLTLLFTGVIQFEISGFGNYLVPEGKSRVPNVVNKSVEKAEELLKDRNLKIKIMDKQFSEDIPKDRILTQSFAAGELVDREAVVEVLVSGGEKNAENGYLLKDGEAFVPDIQYKTMEEALHLLQEAELTAEVAYRMDETVDTGKVIEQNPTAGKLAEKGDMVLFFVSGEEPKEEEETTEPKEEEPPVQQEVEIPPETVPELPAETGEGLRPIEATKLLTEVNLYRTAAGIAPLSWDDNMAAHAQSLAAAFANGQAGTSSYVVIGRQCNGAKNAAKAVSDWMTGSPYIPCEADKLLNAGYTSMGGALYYLANGYYKYYWVICLR